MSDVSEVDLRPAEMARRQIDFARNYTLSLLEDLSSDEWFFAPPGGVTHIAWQVGHLAMAEYGLALFRQRGRRKEDQELMSSRFRKQYSRGSTPSFDAHSQPPVEEILATLHRVHQQAMIELPCYTQDELNEPIPEPYAAYNTKLGALLFCAQHEMLHAGQIGLLRRQLGKPPLR